MSRKSYEESFKLQMIQLVNAGTSQADVCREFDLNSNTLSQWVSKYGAKASTSGSTDLTEQQKEIIALKKKLKETEMERDILKQAALIFAKK